MINFKININQVKGFLAEDEALALYAHAKEVGGWGPILEIGSYCGKSTLFLAQACQEVSSQIYALDHHRGSEEHQLGEEYHDPDLFNQQDQLMNSFDEFRRNIREAGYDDVVVPIVAASKQAAKFWSTPLSMVFIDGGHSLQAAMNDYQSWAAHIRPGGILAIHDIFPNPEEGGQAPYKIYKLALASGLFTELKMVNTLGLLRRI